MLSAAYTYLVVQRKLGILLSLQAKLVSTVVDYVSDPLPSVFGEARRDQQRPEGPPLPPGHPASPQGKLLGVFFYTFFVGSCGQVPSAQGYHHCP